MTDLKLIDELLCDIVQQQKLSWMDMETHTSITREAMKRLRFAYKSGEMPIITLGLANHFKRTDSTSFHE